MNVRWATRVVLFCFAFAHSFPARRHLAAFFGEPSLSEAWKGFGALFAIVLYLLPPAHVGRAIVTVWRKAPTSLLAVSFALAFAHAIPALDHLPRFLEHPSWGDGWRGFGAAFASLWFTLSVPMQGRLVAALEGATSRLSARPTPPMFRAARL